jgi:hypothetical protein
MISHTHPVALHPCDRQQSIGISPHAESYLAPVIQQNSFKHCPFISLIFPTHFHFQQSVLFTI